MSKPRIEDILARQEYISKNMPKKDPFDKGIMKAIQSAKQSLDMDEDQSDKAMRNSILAFGDSMQKMPKTKGLMANFAQTGRALSPALQTHDEYEDRAKAENKQMMQYQQQLRAAEEAKTANLEQQAYQRERDDQQLAHQQAQLDETRDYHSKSANAANAQGNGADIYGKHLVKANIQDLKDQKKQATLAKIRYDVLKDFAGVLEDAELKGLTGSDVFAEARRRYAKYISGDNKELTLNDMLKQAYIARTKELGGPNPSTTEVQLAFSTIPGVEKHYGASLEQLNRDIEEALDVVDRYNNFNEKMEATGFLGMPNKIDYNKKTNNDNGETLQLINDKGDTINIGVSDAQGFIIAERQGYKPINVHIDDSINEPKSEPESEPKRKSIFDRFRNTNFRDMSVR